MNLLISFLSEDMLAFAFILLIASGIYLSFSSRFLQLQSLKWMFKLLFTAPGTKIDSQNQAQTIGARRALWTAMSTTIGIGNIFGPIVAISFGGPGALMAYLIASVFGSILTYSEVFLAVKHRRLNQNGQIEGGPMSYIEKSLGKEGSWIYAACCALLLAAWSMSQSHTICHMLQAWHISPNVMGIALAILVMGFLYKGITVIAELNAKMVPLMFILYVASTSYIVLSHYAQLPQILKDVVFDFLCLKSVACGLSTHGFFETIRWGLARAIQSNEAGVGTSTIPHSLSNQQEPKKQATLAMISVYANGLICTLSGLTLLVSHRAQEIGDNLDVTIITRIFDDHFSILGQPIFFLVAFLFGFGTILGNAFNGSRCFAYITKERVPFLYTLIVGIGVYIGGIIDLKSAWSVIDYVILPVIAINLISLLLMIRKERKTIFERDQL